MQLNSKTRLILTLITFFSVLIWSCTPISGLLKVVTSFNVVIETQEGCDNPLGGAGTEICDEDEEPIVVLKNQEIKPGEFRGTFSFRSKKQVELTVRVSKYKKVKIPFKIPNGDQFPKYSGDFELKGVDSMQPVDIMGNIDTQESDSELVRGYERCTYKTDESVCHTAGSPPQTHCTTQSVTHHGRQQVEYYFHYTNTELNLDVLAPLTNTVLANYVGKRNLQEKRYTFLGRCR